MARYENDSLTKRSSKFDNFLKKKLDEYSYDRVRAYEACIVSSSRESKQFKFVVLSDECLYLTENPPKTISVAVELNDIFSIEMIDDLPDFLSGQEQKNTTHIQIGYWEDVVEKSKVTQRPTSRNSLHPEDVSPRPEVSSNERISSQIEQSFLSGDYQSDYDDESLKSKSMPSESLRSMLKTTGNGRSSPSLKLSLKKVTINDGNSRTVSPLGSTIDQSMDSGDRRRHQSSSPRNNSKVDKSQSDSSLATTTMTSTCLDEVRRRELKLHLYMLTAESKMLPLIRSAVNNHLIRSTLSMDTEYIQRVMAYSTRNKSPSDIGGKFSEKIDVLFSGLTKDLMDPANSMEKNFELIQELKTATEKYFHLKKLFWKSGDLFSLFVKLLRQYLPKSPENVNSDAGRAHRADEFELIILVIQTLALMFRETEIFPSRLRVLKQQSGKLACDLIEVLTCFPELPVRYVPPTTKASKLLMQTEADKWKCLADAELHELFVEFTSSSTSVLFELLVIAQQSHWGRSDKSFFNVCWLTHILEKLNTTEKFLERIICQVMRSIQPSKMVQLSPHEAILVFQQFNLLHSIMTYSPLLAAFIRNNYTEEFKYYIQGPVLGEKLPDNYPISTRTILLIEEVMAQVLQKSTKLLSSTRYIT